MEAFIFFSDMRAHAVDPHITFHFCCWSYFNGRPLNKHQGGWAEAGSYPQEGSSRLPNIWELSLLQVPFGDQSHRTNISSLLCSSWEVIPCFPPEHLISLNFLFSNYLLLKPKCYLLFVNQYKFIPLAIFPPKVNNYTYFLKLGQWEYFLSLLSFRGIPN